MNISKGKRTVKALHEMDLDLFLQSLGLSEALDKGALRCSICNAVLSRANIGFIYPAGDNVAVCCNNSECLFRVAELRRGEKR